MSKFAKRLDALESRQSAHVIRVLLIRGNEPDALVVVRPGQQSQTTTRQPGETPDAFLRRIGAG